ncbi:uncharacterized protein J3R85_007512 [Psidium guajava]|nr:uncharacterized protein J3R85_007512 [Psidium guajava]
MAITLHSRPCFASKLRHRVHLSLATRRNFAVKSQNLPSDENSTAETDEPSPVAARPKKSASPGLGFGSSPSSSSKSSSAAVTSKIKQRGKRERASIIRRTPVEKPAFISKEDEGNAEEQGRNESAFLLTWLGLGGIILVQGIALAASGFLPDEWDKFFVKYLYPSFTPTVGLFVAGSVAYGVLKYLQKENLEAEE